MSLKRFRHTDKNEPGPGEWSVRHFRNKRTASIGCPDCGDVGVCINHTIDHNGLMSPSLKCDICDYHEVGVVLEDWIPREN